MKLYKKENEYSFINIFILLLLISNNIINILLVIFLYLVIRYNRINHLLNYKYLLINRLINAKLLKYKQTFIYLNANILFKAK